MQHVMLEVPTQQHPLPHLLAVCLGAGVCFSVYERNKALSVSPGDTDPEAVKRRSQVAARFSEFHQA